MLRSTHTARFALRACLAVPLALGTVWLAGCSKGANPEKLVPVNGTVKLGDKVFGKEGLQIVFMRTGKVGGEEWSKSRPHAMDVGSDGTFKGEAAVGRNKVFFYPPVDEKDPESHADAEAAAKKLGIPARYLSDADTDLFVDVPEKGGEVQVVLSSKPGSKKTKGPSGGH